MRIWAMRAEPKDSLHWLAEWEKVIIARFRNRYRRPNSKLVEVR
jgi:hypothetical protein